MRVQILIALLAISFGSSMKAQEAEAEFTQNYTPGHIVSTLAAPNSQSSFYIDLVETLEAKQLLFNSDHRDVSRIEVSGYHLILDATSDNGFNLYERIVGNRNAPRRDLHTLRLEAYRIDIVGNVHFPQTNLEIFASEIRFLDTDSEIAQLSLAPLSFESRADDAVSGTTAKDGASGMPGAEVTLGVRKIVAPTSQVKRIVVNGGAGQDAGHGRKGDTGHSLPRIPCLPTPYDPCHCLPKFDPSTNPANVVFFNNPKIPGSARGSNSWPGDGGPGSPPGRPGVGGSGGIVHYFDGTHSTMISVDGGVSGAAGPEAPGGDPGQPRPAHKVAYNGCRMGAYATHKSQPGAPAPSIDATVPYGEVGRKANSPKLGWLSPANVDATLSFARELYRAEKKLAATEILQSIVQDLVVSQESGLSYATNFPMHQQASVSQANLLIDQISRGLDLYGNPEGWVPVLSLEILTSVYRQEIESSLRSLFLYYQISNRIRKNQIDQNDLHLSSLQVINQISALRSRSTKLTTILNAAYDRSQSVLREIEVIEDIIRQEEARLAAIASDLALERRSEFADLKKSFLFIKTAAAVVSGFEGISLVASLEEMSRNLSDLDSDSDWSDSKRSLEALKDIVKALEDADQKRQKIPDLNGIDADARAILERMLENSAYYQDMTSRLSSLAREYEDLREELPKLQRALTENATDIAHNLELNMVLLRRHLGTKQYGDIHVLDAVEALQSDYEDRLLNYQYQMLVSFEYRFLEPYHEIYALRETYRKFSDILANNNDGELIDLTEAQTSSLVSVFENDIRRIVASAVSVANSQAPQKTGYIEYFLTPEELDALNSGREVVFNPKQRNLLFEGEENHRIQKMVVQRLEIDTLNNSGAFGVLKIVAQHPGRSAIYARGFSYHFLHGQDGISPFQWVFSASLSDIAVPSNSGADVSSALSTVLNVGNIDSSRLGVAPRYTLPGLIADYTLSMRRSGPADASVKRLGFGIEYIYADIP